MYIQTHIQRGVAHVCTEACGEIRFANDCVDHPHDRSSLAVGDCVENLFDFLRSANGNLTKKQYQGYLFEDVFFYSPTNSLVKNGIPFATRVNPCSRRSRRRLVQLPPLGQWEPTKEK